MRREKNAVRMLIVEDDPDMGTGLKDYFEIQGYRVDRAEDGEEGMQMISSLPPYDIVLMDVMMPKKNGFEVLRDARLAGVDSPVIMLTVRNKDRDRVRGFEMGADDYVPKPFSAEELTARVEAVLRRSRKSQLNGTPENYSFGDVKVDFERCTARKNGDFIELTALELDILRYFVKHRGRTVSRSQLLRDVWGISGDITTRTIDRHVASIRKKIEEDPANPEHIETVYGIGYKFMG